MRVIITLIVRMLLYRFIPFKDIDTEAVLSLDDDMTALTSQDIRKAFHIWKLNSNRLVGFNGWSIKWSTETSQWTVVEKGGSGGVDGMAILSSGRCMGWSEALIWDPSQLKVSLIYS